MERDQKTFKTPVGNHEVVIKAWLTGREKRELMNVFLQGNLEFNADSKNISGINFALIDKEQELAWKLIVVSINGKKEGDVVEGSDKPFSVVDAILDMRAEDYDEVVKQVNGIKEDADFEQKKTA